MEVALKNVQYAAFASNETHCFTAKVYVDGKLLCVASNEGHGGCTDFYPAPGRKRDDVKRVDTYLQEHATAPAAGDEMSHKLWATGWRPGLESKVDDLLVRWMLAKELRRHLKKSTLTAGPSGAVWCHKVVFTDAAKDRIKASILTKYPDRQVLNEMPFERALDVYVAHVATLRP